MYYENDVSAQKESTCKGSRLQSKDEHQRRKKGSRCKKVKRKKSFNSLTYHKTALSVVFLLQEKMKYSESLRKNEDFKKVYKEGRSGAVRVLVLYVKKNELGINRLGISVSKKVGNSVVRHRLKRLIREAYRRNEEYFHSYHESEDLVFIARTSAKDCTYYMIESAIRELAGKVRIQKG